MGRGPPAEPGASAAVRAANRAATFGTRATTRSTASWSARRGLHPFRAGGARRGWLLAAAAAWTAVALATTLVLRRRPAPWLAPRVLLDVVDVVAWTPSPSLFPVSSRAIGAAASQRPPPGQSLQIRAPMPLRPRKQAPQKRKPSASTVQNAERLGLRCRTRKVGKSSVTSVTASSKWPFVRSFRSVT